MTPLTSYALRVLAWAALALAAAAALHGCVTLVPPAGLVRLMHQQRARARRAAHHRVAPRPLPKNRPDWRTRDPL